MALQSVVFDGRSLHGSGWRTTGIEGWAEAPDMRRNRAARPGAPGDFANYGIRAGRDITVTGMTVCSSPTEASAVIRDFTAVKQAARLTVTDHARELSAWCEVDQGPKPAYVTDRIFTWTLLLHAPDPNLYGREAFSAVGLPLVIAGSGLTYPLSYPLDYGTDESQGGSLVVANNGTAPYWPRLRISGPCVNPTVTSDTGEWVRFNLSLAADQWLDVDLGERRVLLNGAASRRSLTTTSYGSQWLAVPPGGARLSWAADDSNTTARLSVWSYQGAWA